MSSKELRVDPRALRTLLTYEPDTGRLFWLPRSADVHGRIYPASSVSNFKAFNAQFAGAQAFTAKSAAGYHVGSIGVPFLAHRVIWAMVHDEWPSGQIDHRNGVRNDNRLSNLREATLTQNGKNGGSHADSTSRFVGVSRSKGDSRWCAYIMDNGIQVSLGRFHDESEAAMARDAAAIRLHGEFARLNFPQKPEPVENWKSIGDLARRIVEKAGQKNG